MKAKPNTLSDSSGNVAVIEQLKAIVDQLGQALLALDGVGAHISAAHIDAALHALQSEARALTWDQVLELDFRDMDEMIQAVFTGRDIGALAGPMVGGEAE